MIGAGISGNLAARLLATRHQVQLFEANGYAGGHTNTVDISTPEGHRGVDTGFMVYNNETYPNFSRMLAMLGVESQATEMSFSVSCGATGLEYNGTSLNGLFAQRSNLVNPGFYRMLSDIVRFNRRGEKFAKEADPNSSQTLGEFLNRNRLGQQFRRQYLVPMLAAIWSAAPNTVEQLPAYFILGFMHNHGLMRLRNRPKWRTIVGGARRYVEALLAPIASSVRLRAPVSRIERQARGVLVHPENASPEEYDAVVLATHADRSLAMLADATSSEREVLGALPYQSNTAVLHSDKNQLPRNKRARASWNYRIPVGSTVAQNSASVTYDLNRLQNVPAIDPILVTLNPAETIDPKAIYQTITYRHPAFNLQSVAAQRSWKEINGVRRTWFCGAYWGYGFHEDGVNSALRVAGQFGISLEHLATPIASMPSLTQQRSALATSPSPLLEVE